MTKYDKSLWVLLKELQSAKISVFDTLTRFQILECILRALKNLQDKGFCHLDLKPSNVLINVNGPKWNGDLVLTDFGLSGTIESATGSAGTPGFGSPEQFVGQVHKHSDNYGLGKLALLLIFPWNTAWELLATPKNEVDVIARNTDGYEFISQLLHVSLFN